MIKTHFTKKEIFTIPNILSFFRILLIPVILWLYCVIKDYKSAVVFVIISALTDIIDGRIARKFNLVSDFGKVIDPIADKLTQASLMFALVSRYNLLWILIVLFIIKETFMLLFGYITLEVTNTVNSARWYGKVNTVILYGVMASLLLFTNIPGSTASFMIGFCAAVMAATLILYINFYVNILKNTEQKKASKDQN